MKKKVLILVMSVLLIVGAGIVYYTLWPNDVVKKNDKVVAGECNWSSTIAYSINQSVIVALIDDRQLKSNSNDIYMSDALNLMISVEEIKEAFDCAVNVYDDSILIEKGNNKLRCFYNVNTYEYNDEFYEQDEEVVSDRNNTYIPASILCKSFDYKYNFDLLLNQAQINSNNTDQKNVPYRYNYEEVGRVPQVRNQGKFGTCWAFAALTALESTLLPGEKYEFSADHMSLNNSFSLKQSEGGDYTMSMAYLLSWQGPVLESEDPYGDGYSPDNLQEAKHVQEIQMISSKDYDTIKDMIFKYGGVQSSFYASVLSPDIDQTRYYNDETNSYCYLGTAKPNHDIVIIGWDDGYSKDNFAVKPEGDGAFICRNSWGSNFGDNGDFYISYYDSNIGVHNTVYTKVEDTDNYDNIYQTDLCGFVGQLGYEEDNAYFANAYVSNGDEALKAVGFYATGNDTEYSIYVCENFEDASSLSKRSDPIKTGKLSNSGYYTINLDNPINFKPGQKYAVIVRIKTPESLRPVAVEFDSGPETDTFILDDGEGYVSLKGIAWDRAEDTNNCNVCLKAYTDNVQTGK